MKKFRHLIPATFYGVFSAFIFNSKIGSDFLTNGQGLMTVSFLFFVPLSSGFLLSFFQPDSLKKKTFYFSLSIFTSSLLISIFSFLLHFDSIICIIFAFPVFAFMILSAHFSGTYFSSIPKNRFTLFLILIFPFFVSLAENKIEFDEEISTIHVSVLVSADQKTIWKNLTQVKTTNRKISEFSFLNWLGFPQPVQASLDSVKFGSSRISEFEYGFSFVETVSDFIPEKEITFLIQPNANSKFSSFIDQHLTPGGKYFEVESGRYEIEKISEEKSKLSLTTLIRLKTHFNFYSGFWANRIMKNIQEILLESIKENSETPN